MIAADPKVAKIEAVAEALRFYLGHSPRAGEFVASALVALQERRSSLQCTTESIVASLLLAYRLGWHLSENGTAYLRTVTNTKAGAVELLPVPNYRGLVETMRRHSSVSSVMVDVVHDRDRFVDRRGLRPKFLHEPYRGPGGRGALVAAYAMLVLLDGSREWRVVYREDIDDVRPKAPHANSPWCWSLRTEGEMWCTIAAKKIAKWAPSSPELSAAIALERAVEIGPTESPRAVEIAASLGIEISALGASEAASSEKFSEPVSSLSVPESPKTLAASPLRCCDCGNDDKIVVAWKIERLASGELSIQCKAHESDSAHTHRICPNCIQTQRNVAGENAKAARAERKNKKNAKPLPLSPRENGSGVGAPAPEPSPSDAPGGVAAALGIEPGSSPLAPDPDNAKELAPPTQAPEASSEGSAVESPAREKASVDGGDTAATIPPQSVSEVPATGEEAFVVRGQAPALSSPVAEALEKLPPAKAARQW